MTSKDTVILRHRSLLDHPALIFKEISGPDARFATQESLEDCGQFDGLHVVAEHDPRLTDAARALAVTLVTRFDPLEYTTYVVRRREDVEKAVDALWRKQTGALEALTDLLLGNRWNDGSGEDEHEDATDRREAEEEADEHREQDGERDRARRAT